MKKSFNASITCRIASTHPDIKYIQNPNEPLTFKDHYILDSDYFEGIDDMIAYMKQDLSLVAGGGYNTDHIYDVSFTIEQTN